MRETLRKIAALMLVAAVACLMLGVASALAAKAKTKKKKARGPVDVTKTVNAPIPDRTPGGVGALDGVLNSTIDVGKRAQGMRIRDVNVTVQTLGTADRGGVFPGPIEASDLTAILRAPNGTHVILFGGLISGFVPPSSFAPFPSIGPLTLDDEARLNLGVFEPHDPEELYVPYAGTARPERKPLAIMDNGPASGTWTLSMVDESNTGTSNLVSWRLNVVTGKPFLTK